MFNLQALQQQAMNDYKAGRHARALEACEQILKLQPGHPGTMAFAAMNAARAGDDARAAELYKQVLKAQPDHVEARYNMAESLRRLGRYEEAIKTYEAVLKRQADVAQAWHGIGLVRQAQGRYEEAIPAFRKAVEMAPKAVEPRRNLGIALEALERFDDAIEVYYEIRRLQPDWLPVMNNLIGALMASGRAGEAVAEAQAWLQMAPASTEAFTRLALAYLEADDRAAAREWLDFDRFVLEMRCEPPPGYASIEEFNRALAAHVTAHPTMRVPDASDPTYHHPNLKITEELLAGEKGPIAELERMMHDATEAYHDHIRASGNHPYIDAWPRRWRISAWATLIEGEGQLVPHIHLDGYMGGCYYPELPEIVTAAENREDKQGWFELGRPEAEMHLSKEPEVRALMPEEGKMLLFPAYFYHCTIPFKAPQRRISIAFDMVPERD